jgi:hypothetical protein
MKGMHKGQEIETMIYSRKTHMFSETLVEHGCKLIKETESIGCKGIIKAFVPC